MSTIIKAIYGEEPEFPSTYHHQDCLRVQIGSKWYDYIGDEPDQAFVDARDLSNAKADKINENRKEAGRRIALLFGVPYGDRMRDKQLNSLVRYNELREKELDETITTPEETEITALRSMKGSINAIRNAENAAATSINAASTPAAVRGITVSWPQ